MKDVARVELGSESYSTLSRFNGKSSTGIAVKLATGANALETASSIDEYLKGAEAFFPQGLKRPCARSTHARGEISIHEVKDPRRSRVLVFWYTCSPELPRYLIPTIAVPVVLPARSACWRRSAIPSTP